MKKIISILLTTSLLSTIFCFNVSAWTGSWDDSYIYQANSYVNVRSEPNANSTIIGNLSKNMIIPGLAAENNWVLVNYYGYVGYVYASYLTQTAKPLDGTNQMIPIGTCRLTGYDACIRCCGKTNGITASGTYAQANRTIGMKGYPYGTRVYIEGLGYYIVEDTGYLGYNHVDVFCNNHTECYAITGYRNVYIVK